MTRTHAQLSLGSVRRPANSLRSILRHWCVQHHAYALAALTMAIGPNHVIAALVTWGSPTVISGDSDVSTNGTLFGAANAGDVAVVVNGVTFAEMQGVTSGNFTFNSSSSTPNQFGVAAPPFSTLSVNYRDLLDSGRFTHSPPGTPPQMTLTISNLTVGTPYEFQWWVNDSRSTGDETRTTTATAGNSIILDHNFQNALGGVGQYAIGTFVADATTQQILFQGLGGGPNAGSTQVNAFQLRAIPEPGGFALMAFVFGIQALVHCSQRTVRPL